MSSSRRVNIKLVDTCQTIEVELVSRLARLEEGVRQVVSRAYLAVLLVAQIWGHGVVQKGQ